jgi:uncharacterized protein (DUF1015 family)
VVDSAEARAFVQGNPASFLHVIRPEIALPEGTEIHADAVYQEAARQLARLQAEGYLIQDDRPALWAYRQIMDGRAQVGIVGCSNVDDYESGRIKKHEYTRPDKEDDRTRHVDTADAQTGPVFLACRSTADLMGLIENWTNRVPEVDFVGWNGVQHTLWRIDGPAELTRAAQVYAGIDAFYIADGHHRAASAWRVRNLRNEAGSDDGAHWHRFLTVVFPDEQLRIMAYNRVVADLNGLSYDAFLTAVRQHFEVSAPGAEPVPPVRHCFSMYLDGQWRLLHAKDPTVNEADAVDCLDVAILQDHLLGPILNIDDPRTNERIRFVGGIRGSDELERLVDQGGGSGVAFSMYPTSMAELFTVADADRVMPPKSTWFEPKLASGLLVHLLSD